MSGNVNTEPLKIRDCIVAVIVVGTNDLQWLGGCFGSLTHSSVSSLHLFFVDNASTDCSSEWVARRFPSVKIITSGVRLGFSAANNYAMEKVFECDPEYIFFLNPDTQTPRELIGNLARFLDDHPEVGVVGPIQTQYHAGRPEAPGELNTWSREMLDHAGKAIFHHWYEVRKMTARNTGGNIAGESALEVPYVQGAALMTRASVIRAVGLFDEMFVTFYEEVDFCRWVAAAGWGVVVLPWLTVQHHAMGTVEKQSRYRTFYMERNKYYSLFMDGTLSWGSMFQILSRWIHTDFRNSPAVNGGVLTQGEKIRIGWDVLRMLPQLLARRRDFVRNDFRRRAKVTCALNIRPFTPHSP